MARQFRRRVALWKAQVEQCLHPDTYADGAFIGIDYGRWVSEAAYTQSVCERLGLRYVETGRDDVLDFGGGSSFDGTLFHGRASAMPVLDRWRVYHDDPYYRALFDRDPDLARLSEQYFQFNPLAGAPVACEPSR
jgi:hypothetical protein